MAERTNFLIGYGERLVDDIIVHTSGGPKSHPYTFGEARKRLAPKVKKTADELQHLPKDLCPGDQAVALVTLHPTYIAKSYYPSDLLKSYGFDTVGSQAREVSPEKWSIKDPPARAVTSELFVAGTRRQFAQFANDIDGLREQSPTGRDLIKIEDFRFQPYGEKLKPLRSRDPEPLLEVILHAQPVVEDQFILEGFEAYLESLDLTGSALI